MQPNDIILKIKMWIAARLCDMSEKQYLKFQYKSRTGRKLHLRKPKRFSEKLNWLKFYDRNPEYTKMVDKYLAKDFVTQTIGPGHVVPLLGVWDSADDLEKDFDKLPNRFVLKTNHDSMAKVLICRDKNTFDKESAIETLRKGLTENYYYASKEWPYKNIVPRIIAEEYLEDKSHDALTDYKFFCFYGEPKFMYISNDGGDIVNTDLFDMDFNHLPFIFVDPNAPVMPERPDQFDEMKQYAAKLSAGIPHLRVDFYVVDGVVYVGELTFFHNAGMFTTNPEEWDYKLGELLKLPPKRKHK